MTIEYNKTHTLCNNITTGTSVVNIFPNSNQHMSRNIIPLPPGVDYKSVQVAGYCRIFESEGVAIEKAMKGSLCFTDEGNIDGLIGYEGEGGGKVVGNWDCFSLVTIELIGLDDRFNLRKLRGKAEGRLLTLQSETSENGSPRLVCDFELLEEEPLQADIDSSPLKSNSDISPQGVPNSKQIIPTSQSAVQQKGSLEEVFSRAGIPAEEVLNILYNLSSRGIHTAGALSTQPARVLIDSGIRIHFAGTVLACCGDVISDSMKVIENNPHSSECEKQRQYPPPAWLFLHRRKTEKSLMQRYFRKLSVNSYFAKVHQYYVPTETPANASDHTKQQVNALYERISQLEGQRDRLLQKFTSENSHLATRTRVAEELEKDLTLKEKCLHEQNSAIRSRKVLSGRVGSLRTENEALRGKLASLQKEAEDSQTTPVKKMNSAKKKIDNDWCPGGPPDLQSRSMSPAARTPAASTTPKKKRPEPILSSAARLIASKFIRTYGSIDQAMSSFKESTGCQNETHVSRQCLTAFFTSHRLVHLLPIFDALPLSAANTYSYEDIRSVIASSCKDKK